MKQGLTDTKEPDSPQKIIYDFGSNNGDDIPYYLLKSDLVVAVEANPTLSDQIKSRFKTEVLNGKLIVENCVLTCEASSEKVPFYLHKENHVLSQFPRPDMSQLDWFTEVFLPAGNVVELIQKYGEPFYIKIDLEHYDQVVLQYLFDNNIRPSYISAESHSPKVFELLAGLGGYQSFKLVDGPSIVTKYKDHKIETAIGSQTYSFPHHSAGPFGDDISGSWMNANDLFQLLTAVGLGWKDIHASRPKSQHQNKASFLDTVQVISLAESETRRLEFKTRNPHLNFSFVDGVDGRKLSREEIRETGYFSSDLNYRPGAYGASSSHIELWKKAVATNTIITVAEDDAIFRTDFHDQANKALATLPADWDIILWGWNFDSILSLNIMPGVSESVVVFNQERMRSNTDNFQKMTSEPSILRLSQCFGTPAYTISPLGAQHLLKRCLPLSPFLLSFPLLKDLIPNTCHDISMNREYPTMMAYVSLPPLIVVKNEHATSTIL